MELECNLFNRFVVFQLIERLLSDNDDWYCCFLIWLVLCCIFERFFSLTLFFNNLFKCQALETGADEAFVVGVYGKSEV